MVKFYFTSLFILFFSFSFSQNFPHLNASTGNRNEYPVDKDTNIYMFQGGRMSKADKNFNVIWSNLLSSSTFSFTNILLSKTGSIYFLGVGSTTIGSCFGRINSNGSLAWIKPMNGLTATVAGTVFTANGDCRSILLDSGNNLLISGNISLGPTPNNSTNFIFKCDTNGIPLKFKAFRTDFGGGMVIINDSSGIYKLMGSGYHLGGHVMGIYGYSDISESFVSSASIDGFGCCPGCPFVPTSYWQFFRSKKSSKSFYLFAMTSNSMSTMYSGVIKATDNANVEWVTPVQANLPGSNQFYGRMEEDNSGNIFASIGTTSSTFTGAFVRIDSNGVRDPYFTTMLSGYYAPSFQIPNHSPRVIYDNNYYFDISGYNFPLNPITIQRYDSSLLLPCGSTISSVGNCVYAGNSGWPITATIVPVSSFTLGTVNVTVTPSPFSVNQNFCTVVGLENSSDNRDGVEIYPNPASDKLHIESVQPPERIQIFDLNGKVIKNLESTRDITVADLQSGIYFIRIKTDKGEFNKKFIKD